MRFTSVVPPLITLLGVGAVVQGHSTQGTPFALRRKQQPQQLAQLERLSQVRGGAVFPGGSTAGAAATAAGDRAGARSLGPVARVRGGRTSDIVVLIEALAEAALESSLIVGFIGGAEYLSERFLSDKKQRFSEVARLLMWTAAVFGSGAATEGPKRWLDKSQLFNIDVPMSKDWYTKLRKPWFNPPNWLFPIMWIPLKILQVFACYEMWDKLEERNCLAPAVVVYAVYKSLGDVWNKVFFERRRLNLGTLIISGYFGTLLYGIKIFFEVSDRAGFLFAPTAAWVTVATCLQWSTWLLNRDQKET